MNPPPPERPRSTRRWRRKFGDAFDGLRLGVRGQSSFIVHGFFAALAAVALVVLGCDAFEWCLIVGCIGMVVCAELMNSAIEVLFRGLPQEARDRVFGTLHISAAVVLVASLTAVVVGGIVFGRRIVMCFH